MIGFLFISHSFALQIKPISENATTHAQISTDELTRIAIDQDRIIEVHGISNLYEMKNDPLQGAIFIKSLSDKTKKPFTLFIATEKKHNYILVLSPQNKPADPILLKPTDVQATTWEKQSLYSQTLVALTHAMIDQKTPPGYRIEMISHHSLQRINNLKIKLLRIYQGSHFNGFVYRLSNPTRKTYVLNEPMFYQKGDCAIALSDLTLTPKWEALLYKVKE